MAKKNAPKKAAPKKGAAKAKAPKKVAPRERVTAAASKSHPGHKGPHCVPASALDPNRSKNLVPLSKMVPAHLLVDGADPYA